MMNYYDWKKLPQNTVELKGRSLLLRPLASKDETALGGYFEGLSEATRRLYAPHSFDRAMAAEICKSLETAEGNVFLRLIAVEAGKIVAYFIVILGLRDADRDRCYQALDLKTTCTLAPSVADEWQSGGLGGQMMKYAIECARAFGKKTMVLWGGVQERNARAVHFYTKFGFVPRGEFMCPVVDNGVTIEINNIDMSLDL